MLKEIWNRRNLRSLREKDKNKYIERDELHVEWWKKNGIKWDERSKRRVIQLTKKRWI